MSVNLALRICTQQLQLYLSIFCNIIKAMYHKPVFQTSYLLQFGQRTNCLCLGKPSWLLHTYSSLLLILLTRTFVASLEVTAYGNGTFWNSVTKPPILGIVIPDNTSMTINQTIVLPTIANPDYLEEIYEDNHGLPLECRHDVCNPESTEDYRGRFQWNYTLAGEYAYVVCPYGGWFDNGVTVYAHRPCNPPRQQKLLRNNRLSEDARWGDPDTVVCRFSSNTTNQLQIIREKIIEALKEMIEERISNATEIILPLMQANELLSDDPRRLTPPDVDLAASILDIVIAAATDKVISLTPDFGTEIVNMANHLLNIDITVLDKAGPACLSVAKNLQVLIDYMDLQGEDISIQFTTKNVEVDIQQETTGEFEGPYDFVFKSPEKEAGSEDMRRTVAKIHVPRLQDLVPAIRGDGSKNNLNTTTQPPENPVQGDRQRRGINAVPVSTVRMGAIVYFTSKFFQIETISKFVPSSDDVLMHLQVYRDGVLVEPSDSSQLYITYYHATPRSQSDNETNWFEENCAIGHMYRNDSQLWRSPFRTVDLDWYPESCSLNYTNENYTTCVCVGLELLALIVDLLPTPIPTTPPLPPDPLEFFSFPYSLTLSILSYVGYAFSLVSLILTILTYALFPRLRRGRQTHILLNMCVTLLMYVVFLLSSIAFCDTAIGCRVANIIRVYLILVSLMWNGVEGVHMYLTLVKVFSGYTSYFVLKSAAVAWGLPAIIVAIPLIIDVSIFDGDIVNCSFACQLSRTAFYWVFLLPMLVIVVFNSVVFGFVIKIIYKVHVNDKNTNMLSRVRGAIAVLVLLGITWGFSAAAAINYHYYFEVPLAATFVLQTFFVIGIAFQGFFIFAFHCVRYQDVRQQWRMVLTPKKPLFQKWRARRKSVDPPPSPSAESPQLTREDVVISPPLQMNAPLINSQRNNSQEVGISLMQFRRQNSNTVDTYL